MKEHLGCGNRGIEGCALWNLTGNTEVYRVIQNSRVRVVNILHKEQVEAKHGQ